jgi:hypothetical protein
MFFSFTSRPARNQAASDRRGWENYRVHRHGVVMRHQQDVARGADLAVASGPMIMAAAGRFSITTGLPQISLSLAATTRAVMSIELPGAVGR